MTALKPSPVAELQTTDDLHEMATHIIDSIASVATRNDSYVINDIPKGLNIGADQQMVASVLCGMLATLARHAKGSCIRMSAKVYSNVILVHVKDYNSIANHDIDSGLQTLQPLAEKIGGFVGVSSHRLQVTTLAFSFPNFCMQLN